ncbi:WD40 repeat domain-containing serine/threonine-protein kinase [Candidatus Uabimicrobium amorphum]|uniref:Serine/threonine protein kinase n=1 Tax=Uabimicrobium amorphum TaxID=2596890 RepID=A0A5S9ILF9_UABAM|nr:WD40 repeat domain-containing serine/threonine-protein kinase [Candidatus Uabimicrobium amorphum]BBM84053.1 serine/threonine protein kinase [Candidatus Uabimicrobium amorphum]
MSEPELFLQTAILLNFISPQQARRYFIEFQQQPQKNFFLWLEINGYLMNEQIIKIQQYLQKQQTQMTSETNQISESFFVANKNENCFAETLDVDTPSSSLGAGTQFNHYIIQKELGKGGMGEVYQALDRRLQRVVAIKIIRADVRLTTPQIEQFLAEARAIAQIDHPAIVKIFEIGNTPQHYIAMEYIPGRQLKEAIKSEEWSPKKIAAFIQQCALALDFVHNKNIIHRDLKPSNIMLTQAENPKITDFGLAKELSRKKEGSSGFVGTPAYASPEQVRGAQNISYATDIYSLGAVLYELLTHRPPYQGETFNIFFQILNYDIIAPRSLNPDIPKELEAICLKAMHKARRNRYDNMRAFARDLRNYIENKPVAAKPPSYLGKCAKLLRRNKLISSLVISTFLASIGTIIYLLQAMELQQSVSVLRAKERQLAEDIAKHEKSIGQQQQRLKQQQRQLQEQEQRSQQQEKRLQQQAKKFYRQEITQINRQMEISGNSDDIEERLEFIRKPRHLEWRWLKKKSDTSLHSFFFREQAHHSFLGPHGTINTFYSYHAHTWKPTTTLQTKSDFKKIVYKERVLTNVLRSPNRQVCIYLYTRGIIALENLQTKKRTYIQVVDSGFSSVVGVSFHANSKTAVVWGRGYIYLVDCVNHRLKTTIDLTTLGNNTNYSCELVGDELLFCWYAEVYKVYLPKVKKTEFLLTEGVRRGFVSRIDFTTLQPIIRLKCTRDFWILANANTIYFYNVKSRKTTPFRTGKKGREYEKMTMSHNKKYLVSWGEKNIDLWSIKKKQMVHSFVGHAYKVNACNFSFDDKILFSHGAKGVVKMWDVARRDSINYRNTNLFQTMVINNLVINVGSRKVTIWDLPQQKLLAHHFSIHEFYSVDAIETAPGRYTIVVGHSRNSGLSIFTWNGKELKLQKFYPDLHNKLGRKQPDDLNHHRVRHCYFVDYEGQKLLATTYLDSIFIWGKNLWRDDKPQARQIFKCSRHFIRAVLYDKTKESFVIVDASNVHLWKPFTQIKQTISKLPKTANIISALTAATWLDRERIIAGNSNGKLFMINLEKRKLEKIFRGHYDIVKCCAVNKQKTRLISSDMKGNAYIWDLSANEREITPLLKLRFYSPLNSSAHQSIGHISFVENQKNNIAAYILLTSREATYILHAPYPVAKKQKK